MSVSSPHKRVQNKSYSTHHGHEEGHLRHPHRRRLHERSSGCHRSSCPGSRPGQWSHRAPCWLLARCLGLVFLCLVPLSLMCRKEGAAGNNWWWKLIQMNMYFVLFWWFVNEILICLIILSCLLVTSISHHPQNITTFNQCKKNLRKLKGCYVGNGITSSLNSVLCSEWVLFRIRKREI